MLDVKCRVGIQKRDLVLGWKSQEGFMEEGMGQLGWEGQEDSQNH